MLRRPMVNGELKEGHLAICARPVERDGLCAFHARQAERPASEARDARRFLRSIGRY